MNKKQNINKTKDAGDISSVYKNKLKWKVHTEMECAEMKNVKIVFK